MALARDHAGALGPCLQIAIIIRASAGSQCLLDSQALLRGRCLEPGQLIALPASTLGTFGPAAITVSPRWVKRYCAGPEESVLRASIVVARASSST